MQKKKISKVVEIFEQAQEYIAQGTSYVLNPGIQCTLIFGMTRSGKSTLINYLLGTRLKADMLDPNAKGRDKKLRIMFQNENQLFKPKIGNTYQSQTKFPRKYISYNGPFKGEIYDNPGFGDNRGAAVDISNGALVSKLLNKAKNIRIVLVVDIDNIVTDNATLFISLIKQTNYLFGNLELLKDSCSLVFTKVQKDYGVDDIIHDLSNLVKYITDPEFKKQLLYHLIKNKRISIFHRPTAKGPVDSSQAFQITKQILALKPLSKFDKGKIGVSPQTKTLIYQHNMIILDYTKADLLKLLQYLQNVLRVDNIYSSQQGNKLMTEFGSTFEKKIKINQKDQSLADFIQRLYQAINQAGVRVPSNLLNSIKSKIQLIEFIKSITELNTMEIDLFKNETLAVILSLREKLISKIYQLQYEEGQIKQQQLAEMKESLRQLTRNYNRQVNRFEELIRQQQQKCSYLARMLDDKQERLKDQVRIVNRQSEKMKEEVNQIRRKQSSSCSII